MHYLSFRVDGLCYNNIVVKAVSTLQSFNLCIWVCLGCWIVDTCARLLKKHCTGMELEIPFNGQNFRDKEAIGLFFLFLSLVFQVDFLCCRF